MSQKDDDNSSLGVGNGSLPNDSHVLELSTSCDDAKFTESDLTATEQDIYAEDSNFSFFTNKDEKERCSNYFKDITEAYNKWREALDSMENEEETIAMLNACSTMKAFHSAVLSAVRGEPFFANFQREANKIEELILLHHKGNDSDGRIEEIKKAISTMYRHVQNQCNSGNPCAFSEGGDKELLRYGDLTMKKLFEHTKQMSTLMTDIVNMIEKKILLEADYTKQLKKMAMEQKAAFEQMPTSFPFVDILASLVGAESDYCCSIGEIHDKLLQHRFVHPLKCRIKDFDDVTAELQREWYKKKVHYEKSKDNTKEAYNRYYKACCDLDRELAKVPPVEKSRIVDKEASKTRFYKEFTSCRKQQAACFEELRKKRQWALFTGLDVISQAERKLQSALGHFFSNFTTGFQQRPLVYKALLSETLAKVLNHNENIVYEILYRDSEINSTAKDLETDFEKKENPFEKEATPQASSASSSIKSTASTPVGSSTSSLINKFISPITSYSFTSATHNFENSKVSTGVIKCVTKCIECNEYCYDGHICSKCFCFVHSEHIGQGKVLKYSSCDQVKENPPATLKYFRRSLDEQPKSSSGNPLFLEHCLGLVESHYIKEQGLYREESVKKKAQTLCDKIEDDIYKVTAQDISDHKLIGMVVKHYIRVIPKSLLEEKLFDSWMTLGADIVKSNERGARCPSNVIPGIIYNLQQMSRENRQAAIFLFTHLKNVASHSRFNNMNTDNLGIVFGPNLIRKTISDTNDSFTAKENKEHTDYLKSVTSFMIDNYEQIFENEALTNSFKSQGSFSKSLGGISTTSSNENTNRSSQFSQESDGTYVSVDQFAKPPANGSANLSSNLSVGSSTNSVTPNYKSSNGKLTSGGVDTNMQARPRSGLFENFQSDNNVDRPLVDNIPINRRSEGAPTGGGTSSAMNKTTSAYELR